MRGQCKGLANQNCGALLIGAGEPSVQTKAEGLLRVDLRASVWRAGWLKCPFRAGDGESTPGRTPSGSGARIGG